MNNVPISSILILRFGNNEYSSFFKFWSWAKENWTWKTEARYWPEIWRNGLPVNSARQSTGEVRGSLVDLIWERTDKLNEGQRVIQKSIQPNKSLWITDHEFFNLWRRQKAHSKSSPVTSKPRKENIQKYEFNTGKKKAWKIKLWVGKNWSGTLFVKPIKISISGKFSWSCDWK